MRGKNKNTLVNKHRTASGQLPNAVKLSIRHSEKVNSFIAALNQQATLTSRNAAALISLLEALQNSPIIDVFNWIEGMESDNALGFGYALVFLERCWYKETYGELTLTPMNLFKIKIDVSGHVSEIKHQLTDLMRHKDYPKFIEWLNTYQI